MVSDKHKDKDNSYGCKVERYKLGVRAEGKVEGYKIDHDLPGCISCEACCAVCPENWEMKEDRSGDIKAFPRKEELSEDEFQSNMEAACACPVNAIHIIDKKTGKKLI